MNSNMYTVADMSSTTTPALSTSYDVRPADADGAAVDARSQSLGRTATQTYFARVTEASGGGMTGVAFKAQVSEDGADWDDPTAANWTDIYLVRLDDGVKLKEHTLSVGAGDTAHAAYGTTDNRNAPFSRVLLKSVGANAGAGDLASVKVVGS